MSKIKTIRVKEDVHATLMALGKKKDTMDDILRMVLKRAGIEVGKVEQERSRK